MRRVVSIAFLAAALVILLPSYGLAEQLTSADIDPGDCQVDFGSASFKFDPEDPTVPTRPGNAEVAANQNWIIGQCRMKLSRSELQSIGGPFREAQHYWGFDCSPGIDGVTADELTAFVSHAVLTPSGQLSVMCVAVFVPAP